MARATSGKRSPKEAIDDSSIGGEEKKSDDGDTNANHCPLESSKNGHSNSSSRVAKRKRPDDSGRPKAKSRWMTSGSTATCLCRLVLLDLPLLLLFVLYLSIRGLEYFGHEYLVPQIELMKWTPERTAHELTYYHRRCTAQDQSASDASELILNPDMSLKERVDHMKRHGASVYPDLLSTETATELRNFILEQNKKNEDMIWVIQNSNRWSFYLRVDQHPTVVKALKEVLNNPFLVDALEKIAGRNPAVIEFTTITSAYGAKAQHWHQDVVPEGNGAKYGRTFIPSYSLFIPLQNTTAGMGATGICPGTHMCAEGCDEFCPETGFLMSGRQDNWPAGWGALVNQQTTHRGSPFVDPTAPHRVLFILTFAPRPRFGKQQVETRYIGTGGSYSLHYSQWGATLRDFQNPDKYMRQPWRTLRSFGLYKPVDSDWGWDYLTQASGRIANEDVGFAPHDFEEFVDGNGLSFLPQSLRGDPEVDGPYDSSWINLAFDTLARCNACISRCYIAFAVIYLLSIAVVATRQNRKIAFLILRSSRVLVSHSVILLLAWWAFTWGSNRSWAKNVRSKRLFSLNYNSTKRNPNIPASLPLPTDILVLDDMKSDYMASFSDIIDTVHPGNRAWVDEMSEGATNYHKMPASVQQKLRSILLSNSHKEGRRIMMKNSQGNWAEIESEILKDWLCHRELVSRSNSLIGCAVSQIDFLMSESRFGYWRDTAMHQKHIPDLLRRLEDAIVGWPRREPKNLLSVRRAGTALRTVAVYSILPPVGHISGHWHSGLPSRDITLTEKGLPSLFREGDVIEASYDCDFTEWYRAVITTADADKYTYSVRYDDGDEDHNLHIDCLRPFVPYRQEEMVEIRVEGDSYFAGKIQSWTETKQMYLIDLGDGQVVESHVQNIRRPGKPAVELEVGMNVLAMYPGIPDEYYPGFVAKINKDGTYAVQYDDGDYYSPVQRRYIRPA